MNKFIVSIVCAILCSITSFSQELVVKSFTLNEGDLSARTEKRLDANGNQCALIKVESIPVCEFGGYVIGKVEKKLGAYWVYVCAQNPITKKLVVSSDNYLPLEIEFCKYGIDKIKQGETYTLSIQSVNSSEKNEINGYGYIDLGLSVLWSEFNVGAMSPEEYGDLYAWADVNGNISSKDILDYPLPNSGVTICGTKYDIARHNWGGKWRMPSKKECEELLSNCIIIDEDLFGTSGKRILGPNGNSIFIPKAGGADYTGSSYYKNSCVHVWTGDCTDKENRNAWSVLFSDMHGNHIYNYDRKDKHSVRPVARSQNYKLREYYKETLRNGKCLVKGQILNLTKAYGQEIFTIYDNITNQVLTTVDSSTQGVFEVWVAPNTRLRIEAKNHETIIVDLKDNIICELNRTDIPKFGLG